MGMSAQASLAWGIRLEEPCRDEEGEVYLSTDLRDRIENLLSRNYDLQSLFGDSAPVEFDYAGTYESSDRLLIIKRSYLNSYWGAERVDLEAMQSPSQDEIDALNKVLDAIEYTGDRTIYAFLYAFYG